MIRFFSIPLTILVLVISVESYLLSSNHVLFNRQTRSRNTFLKQATTITNQEGDSTHLLRKNVELYDQQKYGTITSSDLVSPTIRSPSSLYDTKPEVLAPAGGWPQLRAAVANGADACYFGLQEGFNARARASNFAIDELADVMTYLHERGMKGYLVINILVFDEEMSKLEPLVRQIALAGVDALIMQDMGAAALVHAIAPNLPIHGSTQMSITDANGALFTQRLGLGIDRVVVGRELSLGEIASVGHNSGVEIEAFVHGALCVSYSGQCFSSEAWGGRSANRGQCAQACRMPYGLIVNGTLVSLLDDVKYLLSPQDLCAIDLVPQLITAGVKSFKIEGRLKGPEYVAITTKAYRLAVDDAWTKLLASQPTSQPMELASSLTQTQTTPIAAAVSPKITAKTTVISSANPSSLGPVDDQLQQDLRQVFARGQDADHDGLSSGFLEGVKHQSLVRGRSPRHRGVYIGEVIAVVDSQSQAQAHSQVQSQSQGPVRDSKGTRATPKVGNTKGGSSSGGGSGNSVGVVVELQGPVKRGDGLVFDRGDPENKEEGGAVYEVLDHRGVSVGKGLETSTGRVTLYFARGAVDWSRVHPGDLLWRNKDPALDNRLKALTEKGDSGVLPVYLRASGQAGQPLTLELSNKPFINLPPTTTTTVGSNPGACVEVGGVVGYGCTDSVLVPASSRPLGRQELVAAVGSLGDTPFRLFEEQEQQHDNQQSDPNTLRTQGEEMYPRVITTDLATDLFVPAKEIKEARRRTVASLLTGLATHAKAQGLAAVDSSVLPLMRGEAVERAGCDNHDRDDVSDIDNDDHTSSSSSSSAQLSVLCRTPDQVTAACSVPWLHEITLDFLEVHGLRDAVKAVKASGKRVVVATPRIIKPNEERLYTFYLRLQPDALLVRSAGFLNQLLDLGGPGAVLPQSGITIPDLRGDFSLNAANAISAGALLHTGLSRLAPTHDLNADQIMGMAELLGPVGRDKLEVILHQHLAVFHTEHCVFCRFLSNGNSFLDCGHPCETNQVSLRDFDGQDHLVLADMGCRNTVFSAKAQSGAPYLSSFMSAGLRHYRIELVDEQAQDVVPLLNHYQDLLTLCTKASAVPLIDDANRGVANKRGEINKTIHKKDDASRRGDTSKKGIYADIDTQVDVLWSFLEQLPNGHGVPQGVALGSLEPKKEKEWSEMKPTARR